MEKIREAEQRRATKELMAAQRIEEEQRLRRNMEERQREKQEEARAREKIRLKLGQPLHTSALSLAISLHASDLTATPSWGAMWRSASARSRRRPACARRSASSCVSLPTAYFPPLSVVAYASV